MNQRIHLLSCASCRRQLDVSKLEIGDEVQCVCDTVLVVGPPREVTVGGLACGHCGGIISAHDADCPYCKAKLSAEDKKATTLCPCCAERLPNDSRHCKGCGVHLRGVALPPLPKNGACPRCKGRLRVHLLDVAEVIECADGCGGMWCDREAFERMQAETRRATLTGETSESQGHQLPPIPGEDLNAYVPCLTCGDFMIRRQFRVGGRGSGVVLDVCRNHGVWFDKDELYAALAFVREQLAVQSGQDGLPTLSESVFAPRAAETPPRRMEGISAFKPAKRSIGSEIMDVLGSIFTFSLFD